VVLQFAIFVEDGAVAPSARCNGLHVTLTVGVTSHVLLALSVFEC
jgi:hypothetical protein